MMKKDDRKYIEEMTMGIRRREIPNISPWVDNKQMADGLEMEDIVKFLYLDKWKKSFSNRNLKLKDRIKWRKDYELTEGLNEVLLFHGTDRGNIDSILTNGDFE